MEGIQLGDDAMRSAFETIGRGLANILEQLQGMRARWEEQDRQRKNEEKLREVRVGKKTNLKNEAIGRRHCFSAQAMAKKGKALKKPRGRSAGGRRGHRRRSIVDKRPQQWPLQQGQPRQRRATDAVGGRDDASEAL